jgi:hypothetical protein
MSDSTTPQDDKAMPPASAGSATAGIRCEIEKHGNTRWGWGGDCGTNDIISRIEDECDRIDAEFAAILSANKGLHLQVERLLESVRAMMCRWR